MIIAIDAAATDLSLALAAPDGAELAGDGWSADQRRTHELLPRLLALIERSGHVLEEASALAVGIGPGSFTGLRVAMSLAKGLAFSLGRPIVGVPSLVAWLEAEPDARVALARAGAREAFLLDRASGELRIVDPEAARTAPGPAVAATELADAFELTGARPPFGAASAIARLAAERLAAEPAGDDLDRLEPGYLRGPRGIGQVQEGAVRWL
ncbi:MAG TPA: tRNA (adenosine(37)-N6)-threonylcarbamoyltransferase complex dimerization subunit type 1 TsaB [Candidatus Limnocylindria bacterium]|nr:tRNA (adenosine(37)-N6)-threonylcarbamoyltransferase complex dimerization subunit type 1 TsaB [Candidatus Limnocylindria bacterium]